MKIKLAILEKDQICLNRIVKVFETKYADSLQIYSFTDKDSAMSTLDSARIEVFIASDSFEIDVTRLPKRCGFAYLVDSPELESKNGQHVICKYQMAGLIYKQILGIYSENADELSGLKSGDGSCKVIVFQPVSGGVGASTLAAACAMSFAGKGKKALYLNLERMGVSDVFFSANGNEDMDTIIYALKSKKANLPLKLASCVRQAQNGVYFVSGSKLALNMMELKVEEMLLLISELRGLGSFDYIIIDTDFSIGEEGLALYRKANTIAWVCDGSELSDTKLERAYTALSTFEANVDSPVMNRMVLVYNKFRSETGRMVDGIGARTLGKIPRFEGGSCAQLLEQLKSLNAFDSIM